MAGKEIVEPYRLSEMDDERFSELAQDIDAALAAEREAASVIMLKMYDAWKREGWEEGPTLSEAIDRIHDWLCDHDCDPNEPESEAIRALGSRHE